MSRGCGSAHEKRDFNWRACARGRAYLFFLFVPEEICEKAAWQPSSSSAVAAELMGGANDLGSDGQIQQ